MPAEIQVEGLLKDVFCLGLIFRAVHCRNLKGLNERKFKGLARFHCYSVSGGCSSTWIIIFRPVCDLFKFVCPQGGVACMGESLFNHKTTSQRVARTLNIQAGSLSKKLFLLLPDDILGRFISI